MINFPSAKINLGLNVLFKRDDGYHELETLMIQLPFHDILEILPASNFEFKQSGIKVEGDIESNLCVKAFRLIQKKTFDFKYLYALRENYSNGCRVRWRFC